MINVHTVEFSGDMQSSMTVSDFKIIKTGLYVKSKRYNEKLTYDLTLNTPTSSEIKNKTIYRYPKLTLPRMKVDLLKEKHNVKVTRNKDEADYKVVSNIYIDSLSDFNWGNAITISALIEKLKGNGFNQNVINLFDNMPQTDMIFMSTRYYVHNKHSDFITFSDIFQNYSSGSFYYIPTANVTEYLEILNQTNLVMDTHVVSLCNEDSVIIGVEEYRTMQKMIKSGDRENITLALEMIANCNLEASFDYVSLIYYFLYEKMKEATNWNNVNVKTLRKRLSEFTPWGNTQTGSTYNNYLLKLVEEDKLTEFAFKETARYAFHNVIKTSMGLNHEGSKIFTIDVDSIKLNPEYKEKLKSTITGA
jgi:hypothetical protein